MQLLFFGLILVISIGGFSGASAQETENSGALTAKIDCVTIEACRTAIERLQRIQADQRADADNVASERDSAIDYARKVSANSDRLRSEVGELRNKVSVLTSSLAGARKQLKEAGNEATALSSQIASQSQTISVLEQEHAKFGERIKALEKELESRVARISVLEAELTASVDRQNVLRTAVDKLQETGIQLRAEIAGLNDELKVRKERVTELEALLEDARRVAEEFGIENQRLSALEQERRENVSGLQTALERETVLKRSAESALEVTEADLDAALRRATELQAKLDTRQAELATLAEKLTAANKRLAESEAVNGKLQKDLNKGREAQQKMAELTADYARQAREAHDHEAVQKLRDDHARLGGELERAEGAVRALERINLRQEKELIAERARNQTMREMVERENSSQRMLESLVGDLSKITVNDLKPVDITGVNPQDWLINNVYLRYLRYQRLDGLAPRQGSAISTRGVARIQEEMNDWMRENGLDLNRLGLPPSAPGCGQYLCLDGIVGLRTRQVALKIAEINPGFWPGSAEHNQSDESGDRKDD